MDKQKNINTCKYTNRLIGNRQSDKKPKRKIDHQTNTDKQANRQIHKYTIGQTDKQTNRQIDKQTDRQLKKQANRHQIDRQIDKKNAKIQFSPLLRSYFARFGVLNFL